MFLIELAITKLLLIGGEFVEAVLAEVGPVVVGGAVGGDGEGGLDFVEQYFYEHILILGIAAVEDELQVAGHRKPTAAPPAMALELVDVIGREIKLVNT